MSFHSSCYGVMFRYIKLIVSSRKLGVLAIVCFLSAFTISATAQNYIGKVIDENDKPVEGATITVKQTNASTIADQNGAFKITSSKGNTLVISSVNFVTKTYILGNSKDIVVRLDSKTGNLSDVVIIGYGTQKRKDLTGTVSSVDVKKIGELPLPSIDQILSGRAAGVQVTQSSGQAGAGTSIRIRGSNSLNGTSEPLYVVDGFPIINDNAALSASDPIGQPNSLAGTNQSNPNGALNWLNPADIESVEVLRDASATAIYGSRGANGVIIITTKKGRKSDVASVTLNASYGASNINKDKIKLLNANQFATLNNLANENNPSLTNGIVWFTDTTIHGKYFPTPDAFGAGTNWIDAITRTGNTQNYSLSFNGGNDVVYSGSVSTLNQTTPMIGSDFLRNNFRLNMQTNLNKWLNFSNSVVYSATKTDNAPNDTRDVIRYGAFEAALAAAPTEPVYNKNGTLNFNPNLSVLGVAYNPLSLSTQVLNRNTAQTFLDNASLKATVTKGVNLEVRGSIFNFDLLRDIYYNSQTTFTGFSVGGLAGKNTRNVNTGLIESFATVNKSFKNNEFNGVLGYSYQTTTYREVDAGASGFPNDNLKNESLNSGSTQYPTQTSRVEDLLSSYYVRLNDILMNKFLVTFTARYDGSSKFGVGNKWAFFPSGAVSWKLKEESFLKDSKKISDLKIRLSYGETGNQAIQSLQSQSQLGTIQYPVNGTLQTGFQPSVLGNPNLKWETTKEFNAGIDFGFFNQRLTGSINYYEKITTDLLQYLSIPANSGYQNILANIGSISNKGIELELHATPVNTNNFRWDIDLNIAHNKQILTNLGLPGTDTLFEGVPGGNGQISGDGVALIKGQPVGVFYGYVRAGIYQDSADLLKNPGLPGAGPGSVKFKDLNGDGVLNASDQRVIGDPNPKYIYGFSNTFYYKSFDLSLNFQGVLGGDILNVGRAFTEYPDFGGNRLASTLDYWSPSNPNAKYPAPGSVVGAKYISDFWVQSATYLRLKTVTLGYNFKTAGIKFLKSLRVYASGSNLLTFTKYTGFDPEVNSYGQSGIYRNIDYETIPLYRSAVIGVSVGF